MIEVLEAALCQALERLEEPSSPEDLDLEGILTEIAREELGLETLKERKSDSLDFHELAVWGVKSALEAAYHRGVEAARKEGTS